ncbi:transcriptional regulator [Enterovibrio norvegicus FF-162]|uniref:LysR family transcriptional regulator n=1 Tax=Enterovibrio TaxID=188143 RepID=UPI000362EC8B|nr:LysR family transcriptional regulator [Enterovibrio norvegicus]OEE79102.1 transcriptional regulator [Enterovibrio norvegicus FF-162]
MDFKLLEDLVCLAHSTSFTSAARERFVTQPAFSRRIKALEQWVGAELVNRESQQLELTEQGQAFVVEAEEILNRLYLARDSARALKKNANNEISVAAQNSIVQTLFMQWMQHVEKAVGPVYVRLSSDRLADCIDLFVQGTVDYLLCYTHKELGLGIDPSRFQSAVIGMETLVPVSLAVNAQPKYCLPGTEHEPLPLVAYTHQSLFGKAINQLLDKQPCYLTRRYENPFAHTLKSMVLGGYGVAWLPRSFVKDELMRGELCIAGDESWHVPFEVRLYYRDPDSAFTKSIVRISQKMSCEEGPNENHSNEDDTRGVSANENRLSRPIKTGRRFL